MKYLYCICLLILSTQITTAQYWQQAANYTINIDFDVQNHTFKTQQNISYSNNSPDTLTHLFFHLYYNAFQPGSMMDERARTIIDPDHRVADRISKLSPNEFGWHQIKKLTLDGNEQEVLIENTIAEVLLTNPILPGQKVNINLDYESQVPLQIRRTGRNNAEGIDYSMTQWYVKLCEYDEKGWHAHPYVGREFHGIWGDFDVKINIDSDYIVGASGMLKNQDDLKIKKKKKTGELKYKLKGEKTLWHFKAENVIDFAWAADPDYNHIQKVNEQGVILNYYYQDGAKATINWPKLHEYMAAASLFMDNRYGKYPYPVYTFIQGGDGGMEYPMITLITGERSIESLVGVSIHEWMHSWYQLILATNEALHPWMDEGFTSFATSETKNHLRQIGLMEGEVQDNPIYNSMISYTNFALSGNEEALSTHSDHYNTNTAYGVGSYVKGAVYLKQLEYIIGVKAFDKGLLRYYDTWKFKHPNPDRFLRVMEKESGLELDWYNEYFVNTTKYIDYGIDTIYASENKMAKIELSKYGLMPMPLDVLIVTKDDEAFMHYIPTTLMRGEKPMEYLNMVRNVESDWPWTHSQYLLETEIPIDNIAEIIIDPSGRMADVNLGNNVYPQVIIQIEEEENKEP